VTLTEFLLQRLDEDERHARKLDETDRRPLLSHATTINHPERMLWEIDAKRRIVELCRSGDWTNPTVSTLTLEEHATESDVLALLALPYSDHDDYREEWIA
jgi:hypothetical protein